MTLQDRLRGTAVLLSLCLSAGGVAWLASAEGMPWNSGPAEARGVLARYSLPIISQHGDEALISALQARIAADPGGFLNLTMLASAYVARARSTNDPAWYMLAEQAARRSLAIMPRSNPGAQLALCQVAIARHDFAGASRIAAEVARTRPSLVLPVRITLALSTGDVQLANQLADTLVDAAPSCSAHVQRALARESRGDDAGAIADYRWAIEREQAGELQTSVQARSWLGRLHARHGRTAIAVEFYREALHIMPGHGPTLLLLAEAELRSGLAEAAFDDFRRAQTAGMGTVAVEGLSRTEARRGHEAEARRWQHAAEASLRRELAEGSFGHRRELAGLLLAQQTASADREALALLEQESAVRHDVPTLVCLAWALQRAGRLGEARGVVERAVATGFQDAELYERLAAIATAQGDNTAAAAARARSQRIDPGYKLAVGTGMGGLP